MEPRDDDEAGRQQLAVGQPHPGDPAAALAGDDLIDTDPGPHRDAPFGVLPGDESADLGADRLRERRRRGFDKSHRKPEGVQTRGGLTPDRPCADHHRGTVGPGPDRAAQLLRVVEGPQREYPRNVLRAGKGPGQQSGREHQRAIGLLIRRAVGT